jgi:hypothetical protein
MALPKSPVARITLAICLSVLVHLALLFTPMIELAPTEVPLPPLMAKLEPLPRIAPAPKPKPKEPPKPATAKPAAPVAEKLPAPDIPRADMPEPASAVTPTASEVAAATVTAEEANKTEEPQPAHPLPKKAQLNYSVYKGSNFKVGEARLRFQIADDKDYSIEVGANTTGIVSLFKKFDLVQTSIGVLTAQGLRSNEFSETRLSGDGQEYHTAKFNWMEKTLSFSGGGSVALPDRSQDIVSFMFQLSQIPWDSTPIMMNISNGRKLEHYEIDIGAEETIDTQMGKLRAIPFRKRHAPSEEGLDIWLAVEYRLLPVKISKTDRNGNVDSQLVISEIRVADE